MSSEIVKVGIKFPASPGPVVFANNATLQRDENDTVYLSFFQVIPPVVIAKSDTEMKEQITGIGEIEAIPVSRIVMSGKDAKKVLDLLKRHLEDSHE